jgi:geranylgeranyl diphosphate synthase, type I
MHRVATPHSVGEFKTNLKTYQSLIDEDIAQFSKSVVVNTAEKFGNYSAESMEVFCDVLSRGGKRIRGALTMLAYEMYGGKDPAVALGAARVMEIVQTYLLVADDVYDRSEIRRGKPSAHEIYRLRHEARSWKDDSKHFGESMAFNSGLVGCHMAMVLTAELAENDARVRKALLYLNRNLMITGEGQANDIYNEVTEVDSIDPIDNVLVWKTAYYTFINPLQFGAILAGASDRELDHLMEYGLHAGRTFQITDDIVSTFGEQFDSGKSPMDDMREGKRTLLTLHAMQNADKEDAYFLQRMLGNHDLTQADFSKCKRILFDSGSYAHAKNEAEKSAGLATVVAEKYWQSKYPVQYEFLAGLNQFLLERKS